MTGGPPVHEAWRTRRRLTMLERTGTGRSRRSVDRYLAQLPAAVIGRRYGESLFRPAPGWWRLSLSPYLTAIAYLDPKPTSVLDVGCGDGLVTCFYAFLYPEADVIALDLCGLCLVTTRTIASRLGLTNLRIVQGDAVNLRIALPQPDVRPRTCQSLHCVP